MCLLGFMKKVSRNDTWIITLKDFGIWIDKSSEPHFHHNTYSLISKDARGILRVSIGFSFISEIRERVISGN